MVPENLSLVNLCSVAELMRLLMTKSDGQNFTSDWVRVRLVGHEVLSQPGLEGVQI